jgi:PilZ domain-containing protein
MSYGRADKRIRKEIMVELALPNASQREGPAFTQNVSARGMRLTTEHIWRPGEHVQLSSLESGIQMRARVVYCQLLESKKFAVGLELFTPTQEWAKPN